MDTIKTTGSQAETSIAPRQLHQPMAAGGPVELLDVRTPAEFDGAHVPGARLIPLGDLDPASFRRQFGEGDGPVYVLCQSGGRARRAIEKLAAAGIGRGVLVEGGTEGWINAGLPVTLGKGAGWPIMRQVQIIVGLLSALGAALALTVNPYFALVPLVMGCGLLFAGISGICGLAILLSRMPWNRQRQCGACCAGKGGHAQ